MSDNPGFNLPPEMIEEAAKMIGPDRRFPLAVMQRHFRISVFRALDLCRVLTEKGICRPFEPAGSKHEGDSQRSDGTLCFGQEQPSQQAPLATTGKPAEGVPHNKKKGYHRKKGNK